MEEKDNALIHGGDHENNEIDLDEDLENLNIQQNQEETFRTEFENELKLNFVVPMASKSKESSSS
jgi:hypothetical protein